MTQWSIKIFVENEIRNSKKLRRVLITELMLILVLTALFTVAFITLGEWNIIYSVVLFVFLTLILLGLYSLYDSISYLKRATKFKEYIDEVYNRKNVR